MYRIIPAVSTIAQEPTSSMPISNSATSESHVHVDQHQVTMLLDTPDTTSGDLIFPEVPTDEISLAPNSFFPPVPMHVPEPRTAVSFVEKPKQHDAGVPQLHS